jgi:osmotically-inducible protein OsmY
MRRFLFGVVIASVTAALPNAAMGGDREIAKSVMSELQQYKDAGQLKGFDINLKVEDGIVYLSGEVANREQRSLIAQAAATAAGSKNVVDEIQVRTGQPVAATQTEVAGTESSVQPASNIDLPIAPSDQDAAITDAIVNRLASAKSEGTLRGFNLDVSTVSGDVWVRGSVSSEPQKQLVLEAARKTPGVSRVIDDVTVIEKSSVLPASTEMPLPIPTPIAVAPVPETAKSNRGLIATRIEEASPATTPTPISQGSSMPTMGYAMESTPMQAVPMQAVPMQGVPMQTAPVQAGPQPFAPSQMVGYPMQGGMVGGPVPMQYGAQIGMGAPRYDQPNLPNYAWPSYAAYPNYAAVTYPKQYSPSAWPYIGPFYPYPQVPLGWRKVSLQWDDGLWYLDFTSK